MLPSPVNNTMNKCNLFEERYYDTMLLNKQITPTFRCIEWLK